MRTTEFIKWKDMAQQKSILKEFAKEDKYSTMVVMLLRNGKKIGTREFGGMDNKPEKTREEGGGIYNDIYLLIHISKTLEGSKSPSNEGIFI